MPKFVIDFMLFRDRKDPYSILAGVIGWATLVLIASVFSTFYYLW
jgi:hypothetical protein